MGNIVRDLGGNTTKIHSRSRFAPSLGSGSTAKISHREIFSAQDDTNEDCLEFLFKIIKFDVLWLDLHQK